MTQKKRNAENKISAKAAPSAATAAMCAVVNHEPPPESSVVGDFGVVEVPGGGGEL